MMTTLLQTDENGNVIVHPLVRYTAHQLEGPTVLLALHYWHAQEALDIGFDQSIQLGLTGQQCLELAYELTRAAGGIHERDVSVGTPEPARGEAGSDQMTRQAYQGDSGQQCAIDEVALQGG